VSSVSVVSSSVRDWLSSGLLGDLASERMRRYEEKSGRLVWRVARTSLRVEEGGLDFVDLDRVCYGGGEERCLRLDLEERVCCLHGGDVYWIRRLFGSGMMWTESWQLRGVEDHVLAHAVIGEATGRSA
jgi:hypothetical protein